MLKKYLGEIKKEVAQSGTISPECKEEINQLICRMETSPNKENAGALRSKVLEFEVEHSELSALVNRVFMMLSDMGV